MPKHSSDFKNPYAPLLDRLARAPIAYQTFVMESLLQCGGFSCGEEELRLLEIMGAPLCYDNAFVALTTSTTPLAKQRFCFVDVETNGSNPSKNQVIEIGAVLYENGAIIDRFESFVFCSQIPASITELTGIALDDVVDAPVLEVVMERFRHFLGTALFVAHNVEFDYGFLNAMFVRCNLGWLCNRKLCTIQLARKTIPATHYNLGALNAQLGIGAPVLHRAYADALTALRIFEHALAAIPQDVRTAEELIAFSLGTFADKA